MAAASKKKTHTIVVSFAGVATLFASGGWFGGRAAARTSREQLPAVTPTVKIVMESDPVMENRVSRAERDVAQLKKDYDDFKQAVYERLGEIRTDGARMHGELMAEIRSISPRPQDRK